MTGLTTFIYIVAAVLVLTFAVMWWADRRKVQNDAKPDPLHDGPDGL